MDTKKLRQKLLDLAIRGKLVPQDPNDEPSSELREQAVEVRLVPLDPVDEGEVFAEGADDAALLGEGRDGNQEVGNNALV